jgi:hypothetical protein
MGGDRTSASPRPPSADLRSATLGPHSMMHQQNTAFHSNNHIPAVTNQHGLPIPAHLQGKIGPMLAGPHLGSMPYLPNMHVAQPQPNPMGHLVPGWARPRGSLTGFNAPPTMVKNNTSEIYVYNVLGTYPIKRKRTHVKRCI